MSLFPVCLCGQPIKDVGVNLCDTCYENTTELERLEAFHFLLRPVVLFADHAPPLPTLGYNEQGNIVAVEDT